MTITIIVIALVAAFVIFIGVQIHKAAEATSDRGGSRSARGWNDCEAIDGFDYVIEEGSNDAKIYEGRGDAYVGLKQYDAAIKDYHADRVDKSNQELLGAKGVKPDSRQARTKMPWRSSTR